MTMARQFRAMGDVLGLIQTRIESAVDSDASGSDKAISAAPTEPMRRALRKLHGIEISGPRITLNAGQLNAEHTEIVARNLQRPLSPKELAPAQVGNQVITEPFLLDARRRMPRIWIANTPGASAPLIDHENWPA